MIEAETKRRPNIAYRRGGRKVWSGFAALVLNVSVACFGPLPASIAGPPPPIPERDVTIAFVRVLPPGGAYQPDAIEFDELDPGLQAGMRGFFTDPEVYMYHLLRKQTIHLGDPQLVRIGPREEFEFRRVGESVECANVDDGVVSLWSDKSPKELSEHGYLCNDHRLNQDVYVVAWVPQKTPALGR